MTLSVADLFVFPAAHRSPDTDRVAAAQMLACDDRALDELVHKGLPVGDDGRFDSRELFNLGLHSGTGRTVPEQAFAYSLRWMRGTTESLLAPRRSTFALSSSCDCGEPSTLASPGTYDGAVLDLVRDAHSVTALVHTQGAVAPLVSPALRAVVSEFAALGVRWVKLPDALREDETLVRTHRVATCESASRYLAAQCTAAGLTATTRIGWVIGMLDLVHAWVEVTDDDGVTKVVDPIFTLFASTIKDANPALTDPLTTLRTNRLIPTALGVGDRVAAHPCPAARFTTRIQPAKEPR